MEHRGRIFEYLRMAAVHPLVPCTRQPPRFPNRLFVCVASKVGFRDVVAFSNVGNFI